MKRIVSIAVFALLAGCQSIARPIVQPQMRLAAISVDNLGNHEQRFILHLELHNAGGRPLRIAYLEYRLRLNGQDFGAGEYRRLTVLPAGDTLRLRVPLTSTLARVFALAGLTGKRLRYRLAGWMGLAGEAARPFEISSELRRDRFTAVPRSV